MGFLKISLRTELFKLSIYLSLAFTYIVYPLMIILLAVTYSDWADKLFEVDSNSKLLSGLVIPIVLTTAVTFGGYSVWREFISRNTCPSRSPIGSLRPTAEMVCYVAWNVGLLETSFLLFTTNTRTRTGAAVSIVLDFVIVASLSNFVHRFVFWDRRMSAKYLSWSFVSIGVKLISTFIDFYIVFTTNASNKPFFELALLTCSLLQRLGSTFSNRIFRINVWDTSEDLSSRYAGMLLMVDSLAGSDSKEPEIQLFYQGMMQSCPNLRKTKHNQTSSSANIEPVDPNARRFVVSLVSPAADKKTPLRANETNASSENPKEVKTETSSWWNRVGFSKRAKTRSNNEGFELAKQYDPSQTDSPQSQQEAQANETVESKKSSLTLDKVYDALIEYAKGLDQSDERVWQLLLLLHMHRGFPSLVVLSRLLQRLESRALKRGISAQLEYYNFRKLYETKLDVLYKGTATEGEQPTMHSVWDIYCTMDTNDNESKWQGGSRTNRIHRFTDGTEQTELAKVLTVNKGPVPAKNLVEPNWPFDQLKYYNMVVAKVLKLTDTRKAIFSNLQSDKKTSSRFVYSCNDQTLNYHCQIKKDFQIFAANPPQFASYVYPMFIYYFSLIRNSPRLSKSILSAYKTKLFKVASQVSRKCRFDDVDWIQSSCVALQLSLDFKDLGVILGASLNYAEHLGEPDADLRDRTDNWIVGRSMDSLLPSEFRVKHKQAVLKSQQLEHLQIHERPFFLMGFDDRLRSTQGVVKVLPCLSKRITAVSLLNFQYNPGSALVLVEKDMNILHAEKRFWDALQDHPVDSLEDLSQDFQIALKLYTFMVTKNQHLMKENKFPPLDQVFRGANNPSITNSELGKNLSALAAQLYSCFQEFWVNNEAKGLAFGIPADSPYWGAFEDDQIVGGFEWNPASSICSDVYKVYLRLAKVVQKSSHKKQQKPQGDVQSSQVQTLLPKLSLLAGALIKDTKSGSHQTGTQVPFRTGENAFKEAVPMSVSDRPRFAIGTPYPHSSIRKSPIGVNHDSSDNPSPQAQQFVQGGDSPLLTERNSPENSHMAKPPTRLEKIGKTDDPNVISPDGGLAM